MSRLPLLAIGASLLLGGCIPNEAADLGHAPASAFVNVERDVAIPPGGARWAARRLGRAVRAVADGDTGAVRAEISAAPPGEASALRRILVGHGVDPARITTATEPLPRRSPVVVSLMRAVALRADCRAAVALAFGNDPLPSLMSFAHCDQADNLNAMLADPADLVAPPDLGHADGAYLVDGITSWRTNRQAGLTGEGTTGSSGLGSTFGSTASPITTAVAGIPAAAGRTVAAPASTP